MTLELKCNAINCRSSLDDGRACVTSCSHLFCTKCANNAFAKALVCPACDTSLPEQEDIVLVEMNPSEAFKSSVLSGLRPEIIMDICGRALSFWIYQSGQEMFFQQMLYKNLDNQYAVLKNQFNSLHSQTGQEFQLLKDRHLQTQKEFEQEKRKTQTLQEQINDKQRQLQKLQTHYDKLKRRLLLESVPSGSNLTPMGTPRSANNRHADRSLPLREESQPLRDITTAYATANTNFQHSTQSHHLHVGAGHRGKVDVLSDTSFYGSAAQPHGNSVDLKHRPSPLFFRWQSNKQEMSGMMGMAVRYFSLAEEQWLDRWMLRAALLLLTTLLAVLLTRARSSAANNRTHPSFSTVANGIQSPSDVSANDSDDESDEEEEEDYAKRYKMVLVIRMDLKMSSGKIAAQCCHACLAAYRLTRRNNPQALKNWARSGQAKVTLRCPDESEMLRLESLADQAITSDTKHPLTAISICDAGRTQIAAGSRTVLAIGPALASDIDKITGGLKLY